MDSRLDQKVDFKWYYQWKSINTDGNLYLCQMKKTLVGCLTLVASSVAAIVDGDHIISSKISLNS